MPPPTHLSDRLKNSCDNIWVEFNALAAEFADINLGQGQPDYAPPVRVQKHLAQVAMEGNTFLQYTREQGHPRLVKAISALYSPLFGRTIDSHSEVLVTHGAYESLQNAFLGLVNSGDEVILIEPFYDSYLPMARMVGAVPVCIPLRPAVENPTSSKDWKLDTDELVSKFTSKTKLLLLNNPNNPLGKVYTRAELLIIAELCCKHDVICVSDEVYEWLVYPGSEHVRIATLPGMWTKTVSICSASKAFSVTGWRVGWSIGPKSLIDCVMIAHQTGDCTCTTPGQEAIARCIEEEMTKLNSNDSLFRTQMLELADKRDRFTEILIDCGFKPCLPEAGYFIIADWSTYGVNREQLDNSANETDDFKFARWMIREKKLVAIPPSAFYESNKHIAAQYIRFCFFKTDDKLEKAYQLLQI